MLNHDTLTQLRAPFCTPSAHSTVMVADFSHVHAFQFYIITIMYGTLKKHVTLKCKYFLTLPQVFPITLFDGCVF